MTENEFELIKIIESKSHSVLDRMSRIEEITTPKELMFLHEDIEWVLGKLTVTINTGQVRSKDALITLETMKQGLIEALVYIDQQLD